MSVPDNGLELDRVNSRVNINYGASRIASVNASGLSVVGTFNPSGAVTIDAGGLTVTAGGATITGTTTIDTSCTNLTLSGLPTGACCLTSGQVYVGLSGCCCCVGTVMIVP